MCTSGRLTSGNMAEYGIFMKSVTMSTNRMKQACDFYERLGFKATYGGADADFTSFKVGTQAHINLVVRGQQSPDWWGRVTFFVNGLDEFYQEVTRKGVRPESEPQDSQYGERFFIVVDPDGHEICFAEKPADNAMGRKYSVAGYYPQ